MWLGVGMTKATNKKKSLARPLAKVGDPYVTSDGRIIAPFQEAKAEPGKVSTTKFKPQRKRALRDLPVQPAIMNGIACVFMYTILGVSDREIAEAMKVTVTDVGNVRKSPAYAECFDNVVNEFINVNSELMHARIAAYGQNALSSVADIAFNGKREANKLRASVDLLDRGGFTKKDNTGRGVGNNELRIVVTDGDANVTVSLNGMERADAEQV